MYHDHYHILARWIFTKVRYLSLLMAVFLCACASLPTDYSKPPSSAIRDTSDSFLAQKIEPLAAKHPGESGFYVLSSGVDALSARLRLAEKSEKSIDVQYYYVLPDITGGLLFDQLLKAADRGVRVRVLLDDISTKGYEQLFGVLSANPNFEIRLTNPFANRKEPALDFVSDFKRVNHRMHNKSITFDSVATIVGGRNIAVEYFGDSENFNYYDLDVAAFGKVADEVSTEFDTYWNADETIPVTAFIEPDDSPESMQALQKQFDELVQEARVTPYAAALHSALDEQLLQGDGDNLVWAPAQIVYDLPYGETTETGVAGPKVLGGIIESVTDAATEELFVVSPYFVPGEVGVQHFRALRERGVRCIVVTNSLASTDVVAVYSGYKDYQKPLLELGVELWEVMTYPDKPGRQRGAPTDKRSLHAKTFTVDRKRIFVGSFNWDGRSRNINTEMGVLIESDELAARLIDNVSAALTGAAWKLRLNDKGEVEWVGYLDDGTEVVYTKPPQTSAWKRFTATIQDVNAFEDEL